MTTPKNIVSITKRMIQALRRCQDDMVKVEMIRRIHNNAERLAPNPEWFVHTVSAVLYFGAEAVPEWVSTYITSVPAENQCSVL